MAASQIQAVIGVPELGMAIMEWIERPRDMCSLRLTCRQFNAVVAHRFWLSVQLPWLPPESHPERQMWPFYGTSNMLAAYARSLGVRRIAAETGFKYTEPGHWSWAVSDPSSTDMNATVDTLFHGLEQTLLHTPRLLAFKSDSWPRLLDFFMLLDRYCPEIKSIQLRANDSDEQGLRVPDVGHRGPWAADPTRFIFPFGNTKYRTLDSGLVESPSFINFKHLTVLSLISFPFPGSSENYPEHLRCLVSLLMASPNLKQLELSATYRRARHRNLADPFGSTMLLPYLCQEYKIAGGRPLHLHGLWLGIRCGLAPVQHAWSLEPAHQFMYLADLAHLSYLEELHLHELDREDDPRNLSGGSTPAFGSAPDYTNEEAICLVCPEILPQLRKITWPWMSGYSWARLVANVGEDIDNEYIANLEAHFVISDHGYPRHPLTSRMLMPELQISTLGPSFGGLVLRSLGRAILQPECLMIARLFRKSHLNARSFSIPMTWDLFYLSVHLYHNPHVDEFIATFAEMEDLRELWLTDPGTDHVVTPIIEARGSRPNKTDDSVAMEFALRCTKLEYLRLIQFAWKITRQKDTGRPILRRLSPWAVENCIPEAFRLRCPPSVL
ncbi:hypothetical protein B0H63DRAFT_521817 [Podospora didyma]|uniref:F-box domain-containing protein n=1 Tax=Podospora didyma TaxID=330526 RepID=A0AAE0NUQ4_9PEZI|nr:hypothetical protein B0H63DRAFT_521817 [Podospora didyma]